MLQAHVHQRQLRWGHLHWREQAQPAPAGGRKAGWSAGRWAWGGDRAHALCGRHDLSIAMGDQEAGGYKPSACKLLGRLLRAASFSEACFCQSARLPRVPSKDGYTRSMWEAFGRWRSRQAAHSRETAWLAHASLPPARPVSRAPHPHALKKLSPTLSSAKGRVSSFEAPARTRGGTRKLFPEVCTVDSRVEGLRAACGLVSRRAGGGRLPRTAWPLCPLLYLCWCRQTPVSVAPLAVQSDCAQAATLPRLARASAPRRSTGPLPWLW